MIMHLKTESEESQEWVQYPKLCSKPKGLCPSPPGYEGILLDSCGKEEATHTQTSKPKPWCFPALL